MRVNTAPWYKYRDELKTLVIEEGVTSIGDYAFFDCDSLIKITITDSVASIGYRVFENCSSLEKVTILDGMTNMSRFMFDGCSKLKHVRIPSSISSISGRAFARCSSLESIKIPEGISAIDSEAFADCSSLRKVFIPKSVNSIDESAFFYSFNESEVNENLVIYGYIDSYAYGYANNNNIKFAEFIDCDEAGHTWEKEYTVDKESTCIEKGYKSIHCVYCDEVKDTVVIETGGHSFGDWVITKEATETETGEKVRTCTVCGYEEFDIIPVIKTNILWGDADSNGRVLANDAMLVLQYSTKANDGSKMDLEVCDVDGNGRILANDAMLILQYSTKVISKFPVEK